MFNFLGRPRGVSALAAASSIAIIAAISPAQAQEQQRTFDIPAQPLSSALLEFSRQSDVMVVADPTVVNGRQAPALQGSFTPSDALTRLLAGSGLSAAPRPEGGFAVQDPNSPTRLGDASDAAPSDDGATAEILVVGRRTLNADIRRSEDDAQPYVVYSGDEVRNSGASNLEEFFRTRVPANAVTPGSVGGSEQQFLPLQQSNIDLRGLGSNQTLILVDGRRLPSVTDGSSFGQPSINGIPPSAIERIEVLPATASGLYGGGATGGVVNIILKRNFSGFDVEALYGNTFDSDVGRAQFSATGGFSLEDGRSRVMISASHNSQNSLMSMDRDFGQRAFDLFAHNYPVGTFLGAIFTTQFAYGPTPNIVSQTGANLVHDNGTPLNSPWTYVPDGYAGPAGDNAAALLANAGHLRVTGTPRALYSGPTADAISLDFRREMTASIDGYVNLYWDRNTNSFANPQFRTVTLAASAPNNPFQQNIVVTLPLYENDFSLVSESEGESRRANLGAIARLPFDWSGVLDYGWSQNRTSYVGRNVLNTIGSGNATLQAAALTDLRTYPIANLPGLFSLNVSATEQPIVVNLQDLSLRLGGPVAQLPGGRLTLTSLLEYRREYNDDFVQRSGDAAAPTYYWTPDASQEVMSGYVELRAPILSASNAVPLVRELELMAAVRHDEYSTRWAAQNVVVPSANGPFPAQSDAVSELASTDYTVGLRYQPFEDVTFRASYGTGFLPPALRQFKPGLPQIGTPVVLGYAGFADPRRNGEPLLGDPNTGLLTILQGGNLNIQPEQSESLSYGVILTPHLIEGLRISADFTHITKSNEISDGLLPDLAIANERVVRAPLTPADITAGLTAGRIVSIDESAINLLHTDVSAIDIQADYSRETDNFGTWHLYLVGTRQLNFERQFSSTQAAVNSVGFRDGPLDWHFNAGVDWTAGPWTIGWNAQFYNGYSLCAALATSAQCAASNQVRAQGETEVESQTYHDAYVRYEFDGSLSPYLADSEIVLGIQNVLDESPPVLGFNSSGPASSAGDPRLRRFTLTWRKHFDF